MASRTKTAVYLKTMNFERIRARRNLTDGDVAMFININRGTLSMLKNPKKYDNSPSPRVRQAMMELFGASFDDLFFTRNARYIKHKNGERLG